MSLRSAATAIYAARTVGVRRGVNEAEMGGRRRFVIAHVSRAGRATDVCVGPQRIPRAACDGASPSSFALCGSIPCPAQQSGGVDRESGGVGRLTSREETKPSIPALLSGGARAVQFDRSNCRGRVTWIIRRRGWPRSGGRNDLCRRPRSSPRPCQGDMAGNRRSPGRPSPELNPGRRERLVWLEARIPIGSPSARERQRL